MVLIPTYVIDHTYVQFSSKLTAYFGPLNLPKMAPKTSLVQSVLGAKSVNCPKMAGCNTSKEAIEARVVNAIFNNIAARPSKRHLITGKVDRS